MIVVVAYDIYDDKLRDKARRLLLRYGLSRISKSVYAGRINWETAKEIAWVLSKILKGDDSAVIIPVSEKRLLTSPLYLRKIRWLRGDPQGYTLWARAFDDYLTCPLRAYFSMMHAKSHVPYSERGAEYQKEVLISLSELLSEYAVKTFLDQGSRGSYTRGRGLKICAKYGELSICGRPDLVAFVR